MVSAEVIKAVAVTAELCGRTFSEAAAGVFCDDLRGYKPQQVLRALARCRREVKGVLTTADVINRIDDGRPGVEEAWALLPANEEATVVWTAEMAEAHGICSPLLHAGDRIGARMAFKEVYTRLLAQARDEAAPAKWTASLGSDLEARKRALAAAVEDGRLAAEDAYGMCPALPPPPALLLCAPPKNERAAAKARRELKELVAAKREGTHADPLAGFKALRDRDKAGETLTETQRAMWRNALDRVPVGGEVLGGFTPIPRDLLPPAMRKGAKA